MKRLLRAALLEDEDVSFGQSEVDVGLLGTEVLEEDD